VQWLISNLELDTDLQLHLFDLGRDELLADVVAAQGRIENTGLHAALADRWRNQPGAESWSALVGLYEFGPSDTDIGLLAALAVIATQAGGPLLAGGKPALAAEVPFAGWQSLRRSEVAPWIGLAAPRVLLRLPYGKASDPIDSFAFEEFGATPVHEQFLWGTGALACALLIGRAYSDNGWSFQPGDQRDIGDLPAYSYLQGGERALQAAAESYLSDAEAQSLLGAGLMPLLSHRQRNAVSLMRFQSIAEPAAALAGLSGRQG
jgi:predicted component of type VI protein secretion system